MRRQFEYQHWSVFLLRADAFIRAIEWLLRRRLKQVKSRMTHLAECTSSFEPTTLARQDCPFIAFLNCAQMEPANGASDQTMPSPTGYVHGGALRTRKWVSEPPYRSQRLTASIPALLNLRHGLGMEASLISVRRVLIFMCTCVHGVTGHCLHGRARVYRCSIGVRTTAAACL